MDGNAANWIALSVVTLVNIGGWAFTKIYTCGRLSQKVKDLDGTVNNGLVEQVSKTNVEVANLSSRVKILDDTIHNGITEKVNEINASLNNLGGKVDTFIDLTKNRRE